MLYSIENLKKSGYDGTWFIECGCGSQGMYTTSPFGAITQWNQRQD